MLSVLIVTYNSEDVIYACLNSFVDLEYDYEIIIVDNNSRDKTLDVITKYFEKNNFITYYLVKNSTNTGFSSSMNHAFSLSSGEFILSFNPDARLYDSSIVQAIQFMCLNKSVGKVGFSIDEGEGGSSEIVTEFPRFRTCRLVSRLFEKKINTKNDKARVVNWLFGTGILIRRESLNGSSLYTEKLFLFWEEYWLSKKIKKNGYDIYILPSIKIFHEGSTSFKRNFQKLKLARFLSTANEYNARKNEYGVANARFNEILGIVDNTLLITLIYVKYFLKFFQGDISSKTFIYRAELVAQILFLFDNRSNLEINRDLLEKFNR